ncbi:MAG: hypothetical protein CM15mV89_1730 [Caudoviricetes sp.]|nr:MAG: hypothetical protein CM15mV89_1730 [Caudoviricetes sp.]
MLDHQKKFVARDAGAYGNNLRVVIVDKVADKKITKAGHGFDDTAIGTNISDGAAQTM